MKSQRTHPLRLEILLLACVLLAAAGVAYARVSASYHPAEDAAMLMRYSAHLAQGHGIVWNIGEKPVDGATDFLFMVLLAGLHWLGLPLETAVLGVGISAHLLTAALVFWSVARTEPGNPWLGTLSGLLAAVGPGAAYTAAYFGTTTFAFAGALTFHLALRLARAAQPSRRLTLGFSAASLLTGLIRPEGVLLSLFILLGVLVRRERRGWRPILRDTLLVFGGLGLVYFTWRWAYFGYPLPNPFYKKGAGGLHPEVLRQSFLQVYLLNQPYIWLLAGTLAALLVRWLPSLRGSKVAGTLNLVVAGKAMTALSVLVSLAAAAAFLRRSQPQPGMILERYSQTYFTLLMLGAAAALLLIILTLTRGRWLPARLNLPWVRSLLEGETRAWALRSAFVLIPVLGFTLIWVLLSNEMNYLGRFQYPSVPLVLMGAPALLLPLAAWLRARALPFKLLAGSIPALLTLFALWVSLVAFAGQTFPDGRYDAAIFLRQFANKGYTIATSEAGLLPFYSTWRAVDTWGLNDQWITHTGEVSEAYLDRYQPEVIVFHANLQFTEKDPQTKWDWMARKLWNYARSRGYVLAAAFGIDQDDYHYYYIHPSCPDAQAVITYLRQMDYFWYTNGQKAAVLEMDVP